MTLLVQPPTSESPDGGVIEEARARERRQRTLAGVAIVIVASIAGIVVALAGSGSPADTRGTAHRGLPSSKNATTTLAACARGGRSGAPTPLSLLSVLREPSTPIILHPGERPANGYHLARSVAGMNFYVYATRPLQCSTSSVLLLARRSGGQGPGVIAPTAAEIASRGMLGASSSTSGPTFIYGLVPNGVASVTLDYKGEPPITMRTVNNVFAVAESRTKFPISISREAATEVWLAANGSTIKRLIRRLPPD